MSAHTLLSETELFAYLREFHYPDLVRRDDEYDCFDCISADHNLYIELKSRLTHYDLLLIEEMKYKALRKGAYQYKLEPWYINSTPDGVWGFNLAQLPEPEWSMRLMPSTTEFENKDKKMKSVGFISIKDGVPL
jgi:hypothetical protein